LKAGSWPLDEVLESLPQTADFERLPTGAKVPR